jgi:hypothetical protein
MIVSGGAPFKGSIFSLALGKIRKGATTVLLHHHHPQGLDLSIHSVPLLNTLILPA